MESRKDYRHQSDSDKLDSSSYRSDDHSYSSYEITNSNSHSNSKSSLSDTNSSNETCTSCEGSSSSGKSSISKSSCDTSSSCTSDSNMTCSCSSCENYSRSYVGSNTDSRSNTDSSSNTDSNCKSCCKDSRDDSCYYPGKPPNCCPEDCGPVKCKDFNIYWFGSDLSDAGNGRLNLGLEPYTIREIPVPCPEPNPIEIGFGPCARPTDVKVYPEYVAEDIDFKVDMEYDLCQLPEKNHLVSFSMTSSTQTGNITPNAPPNSYGYDYQVYRYLDLYDESTCYAIPEKDLFFYTEVGFNSFFLLLNLIITGVVPDDNVSINEWLNDNLVTYAFKNVTALYSEGKARKMFVQLFDGPMLRSFPWYEKLSCLMTHDLDHIIDLYNWSLVSNTMNPNNLQDKLNHFAQAQVPRFDLTVLTGSSLYIDIFENANAYGIVDALAPDNSKTMIDLGWPNQSFSNQAFFDDFHTSSHTNRVVANFVKTWFQQKIC